MRQYRTCLALVLATLASGSIAPDARAQSVAGDTAGAEPYLLLISIDGFRHDYLDRYPTPNLDRIAAAGIRAASLRPAWPTLTFPNHYSIATGQYPAEHGIVGNRFAADDRESWYEYRDRTTVQDGRWYGGEPVWVAAERAGLRAAAFYFVGTEAPVDGVSPSDWRAFDDDVSGAARVAQALTWLERPLAERPRLVTLYFEHVDVASHRHGPGSPQSIAAIAEVDGWIGSLLDGLQELGLAEQAHVVVVSDHGQARYRAAAPFVLDEHVDIGGVEMIEHGSVAMLYIDDPARARELRDAINADWQHGRAWLRDEAPAYWHVAGAPRIAELLVQADPGHAVIRSRRDSGNVTRGDHGWAPGVRDMHGLFIACGPRLPGGITLPTIEAVAVYPLLLGILDLPDHRETRHPSPLPGLLQPASTLQGSDAARCLNRGDLQ